MSGYKGFEKKKSKLGTTLVIVGLVHVGIAVGLYWVSQTEWGQNLIKVYKLTASKHEEPPPPPEKEPEPEPEPPKPEPELKAEEPPPPQEAPPPPQEAEAPPPVPCWLCGRPTGATIVWHHPVPKSRGGRGGRAPSGGAPSIAGGTCT